MRAAFAPLAWFPRAALALPREGMEAVRLAVTAIIALFLAMGLELDAPHWAGWTVLSVTLATRGASLRKSLWRAGGTLVGVAVALLLVANFAQATLAFDVAIALWLGLLTAASTIESGQRSYGFALIGFTVPIIAFSNIPHPLDTFHEGVDRFSTICLGIACAYISNSFVAIGVPEVSRRLGNRLDDAATACRRWVDVALEERRDPGPMPSGQVMALGEAVIDAFTAQPSLRSGAYPVLRAAPRLRQALAAGLLRSRLPDRAGALSSTLLGLTGGRATWQIARVQAAARALRNGRRFGRRHVTFRPHLLLWNDLDWDGIHALRNALRTVIALSLVNAVWYATEWSSGATAATWSGLLCVLLASHLDPVAESRAFFMGTILAAIVGIFVHYALLTRTGHFLFLAAMLLPVCMLAVLGRSDKRAVWGTGFGFLILGVINPTNVMSYDLAGALNEILAELFGMATAVVAFSALPPPVTDETRRWRARRRLVRGVRAVAFHPRFLLPPRDRWMARGFGRLALITGDGEAHEDAQTMLLIGLLLLALRRVDDRLGRRVAGIVWDAVAAAPAVVAERCAELDGLAAGAGAVSLQGERIGALALLLRGLQLGPWPDLFRRRLFRRVR
ncbi:FUSC family protein [Rhizosaccharibacter radicis]|uniref:FUSC family protein n=1 Tax=Rhizosaccharibacter radicis TaxID=2782605 RepID=A0ABT1VUZ5_9PROT|nr:FUSC family protein [Acetobacteraceae bacterium KSS12]